MRFYAEPFHRVVEALVLNDQPIQPEKKQQKQRQSVHAC